VSSKDVLRSVLGSPPVAGAVRLVNRSERIGEQRRSWLYHHVTKKVPPRPERVFQHVVPGGEPMSFHLVGTVRQLFWTGEYEADALPLFTRYARASEVILDIGAADGVYAIFAAAVNPDAVILAFEPGSRQLPRMVANLAINHQVVQDRVVVVAKALSDHAGVADFHETPGGNSSLNPDFRVVTDTHQVELARGDDVVAELLPDRRVALIKIDTESTEPLVLRGLEDTIRRDRPAIFCEVLAGRTEKDLQVLVDGWGYRTYWLSGSGPVEKPRIVADPTNQYVNWLFLPADQVPLTVT
jgi:FkbM family methyltransferase